MFTMPLTPTWGDIALRLGLTIIGGALIGLNRGEHGRPAGLRTTLLVCLAASISMIQVNFLLGTAGKAQDSFIVLDLMRLPLGILSGMGFIGAGAILKRDDLVLGVTTAATLWFTTTMGLCFGGGQWELGLLALALALFILSVLKRVESCVQQDRRALVKLVLDDQAPPDRELAEQFKAAGLRVAGWKFSWNRDLAQRELDFVLHWRRAPHDLQPPDFIEELAHRPDVRRLEWND